MAEVFGLVELGGLAEGAIGGAEAAAAAGEFGAGAAEGLIPAVEAGGLAGEFGAAAVPGVEIATAPEAFNIASAAGGVGLEAGIPDVMFPSITGVGAEPMGAFPSDIAGTGIPSAVTSPVGVSAPFVNPAAALDPALSPVAPELEGGTLGHIDENAFLPAMRSSSLTGDPLAFEGSPFTETTAKIPFNESPLSGQQFAANQFQQVPGVTTTDFSGTAPPAAEDLSSTGVGRLSFGQNMPPAGAGFPDISSPAASSPAGVSFSDPVSGTELGPTPGDAFTNFASGPMGGQANLTVPNSQLGMFTDTSSLDQFALDNAPPPASSAGEVPISNIVNEPSLNVEQFQVASPSSDFVETLTDVPAATPPEPGIDTPVDPLTGEVNPRGISGEGFNTPRVMGSLQGAPGVPIDTTSPGDPFGDVGALAPSPPLSFAGMTPPPEASSMFSPMEFVPGGDTGTTLGAATAPAAASSGLPFGLTGQQALTGAGLAGVLGASLLGNRQTPAQRQLSQLSSTEQSQGEQTLALAMEGIITPSQQAILDDNFARAKAQLDQQFARMGIVNPANDSSYQGALMNLRNQIYVTQKQQFIDAATANALNLMKLASGGLTTLAGQQVTGDQQLAQNLALALSGASRFATLGAPRTA